MKLFLIITGAVLLIVIVALGVVGYRKSKKLYAEFIENTVKKLPVAKADILELSVEELSTGTRYEFAYDDNGTKATHVAYGKEVKVLHDLQKNERPHIKYRYLKDDVPFPKVRTWAAARGYYDLEIHIEK